MPRRQRLINLGIAAAIAVVAVVVILATSGGSDDTTQEAATPAPTPQSAATSGPKDDTQASPQEPPPIAIAVKNGKVVGGLTKIRVNQGDRITFTVTADVADEVHVHAYDFHKDIEQPGDTVKFSFDADITGITEVELENAHLQIASIRVDP